MNLLIDGTPKEIAEFIFDLQDISIETTADDSVDNSVDDSDDDEIDWKDELEDAVAEILNRYPKIKSLKIETDDNNQHSYCS